MYASLEDLKKRVPEEVLVQLTDDNGLGVVDEAMVLGIAADVDELIDGKLRGVYELPLTSVPGIIKAIALDLLTYELYSRRLTVPESVKDRFANQMKVLDQIHSGAIKLGIGAVITPAAETPSDGMLVSSGDKIFSSDLLERY